MMARTLTVLLVISSLAPLGHSLQCAFCVASVGTHCTGNYIPCDSGSVCGYVYTETTEDTSTKTVSFRRSCIEEHQCNTTGSITAAIGRVRTAISCCDAEKCHPPPHIFPEDNHERNGQVCRSCTTANSDWCYTGDTIECTGNETMCLLQTTRLSGTVSLRTATRGCATRSICDHGSYRTESAGTRVDVDFVCTDGASNLQQKSYISGLLLFVLLDLFH